MCKHCLYEEYIETIEDLLDDLDFEWAQDTLSGILNWITDHNHITEEQITAIDNIIDAVDSQEDEDIYGYD